MIVSADRCQRIAELCQAAERLARAEARGQHHDRRMERLAMMLWACRDAAEQSFEEAMERRSHADRDRSH